MIFNLAEHLKAAPAPRKRGAYAKPLFSRFVRVIPAPLYSPAVHLTYKLERHRAEVAARRAECRTRTCDGSKQLWIERERARGIAA
jgi:hypothetical protein